MFILYKLSIDRSNFNFDKYFSRYEILSRLYWFIKIAITQSKIGHFHPDFDTKKAKSISRKFVRLDQTRETVRENSLIS